MSTFSGCHCYRRRRHCCCCCCYVVLFRKVGDLQFALEEMSIEKSDVEVRSFCCMFHRLAFELDF